MSFFFALTALSHLGVKFYEPTGIAYHREPSNDSTWSGCVVKRIERVLIHAVPLLTVGDKIEFNAAFPHFDGAVL